MPGQRVEHADDRLGVILAGQIVSGPMIEDIPQKQNCIGLFPVIRFEQHAAVISAAVEIGGDKVLHGDTRSFPHCVKIFTIVS